MIEIKKEKIRKMQKFVKLLTETMDADTLGQIIVESGLSNYDIQTLFPGITSKREKIPEVTSEREKEKLSFEVDFTKIEQDFINDIGC